MNIENLKLFKQGLVDNFDRVEKHFNMEFYRSAESIVGYGFDAVECRSKTDCGSHSCLLGRECWVYLFDSMWQYYDNTLQGTIDRLDKVISGEVTEENAKEFLPWHRGSE